MLPQLVWHLQARAVTALVIRLQALLGPADMGLLDTSSMQTRLATLQVSRELKGSLVDAAARLMRKEMYRKVALNLQACHQQCMTSAGWAA